MTAAGPANALKRGNSNAATPHSLWRSALLQLALISAAILILFHRDAADMVMIWWNSSTFNHCLLILPILWWLVDQRKEELAKLTPQPWWPPLLYAGAGALGWLLGDAAGVALARHLGLLMMLQGAVSTFLGAAITRGLAFPLFYAFFLVPMGEELVPILQMITAKICMVLLGWFAIPAHIEGIFIATPNALFRVAEACSGVKFLVAMVALGALVANLCFKSWRRRVAFMAACIIIPILANGIRAFATIYIGHHGNLEFAASFDHVIYGWVFFAVVIALIMGGSWRFFDRRPDDPIFDAAQLTSNARFNLAPIAVSITFLLLASAPILWTSFTAGQAPHVPERIALPKVPGWQVVPYTPRYAWQPHFANPSHTLLARYRNNAGQEVDFYTIVYDRQSEGRELAGFGQGAVPADGSWSWAENCSAPSSAKCERLAAHGKYSREVISYYRVGGVTTGSATQLKLATLKARLLGGDQQAVAILLSAERLDGNNPRAAIDAFTKDLGNIDNLADGYAGLR